MSKRKGSEAFCAECMAPLEFKAHHGGWRAIGKDVDDPDYCPDADLPTFPHKAVMR